MNTAQQRFAWLKWGRENRYNGHHYISYKFGKINSDGDVDIITNIYYDQEFTFKNWCKMWLLLIRCKILNAKYPRDSVAVLDMYGDNIIGFRMANLDDELAYLGYTYTNIKTF